MRSERGSDSRPAALLLLAALPGCWFELGDVVVPDEGCPGSAPQACGTRCLSVEQPCEPEDVSGNYTVQIANGANGCTFAFENWMEGPAGSFPAVNAQDGSTVVTVVEGGFGALLSFVYGGDDGVLRLVGTIEGDRLASEFIGARPSNELACTWTWSIRLDAVADGDLLTGTLTYAPRTNGHPVCETLGIEGCETLQLFNATRPPRGP